MCGDLHHGVEVLRFTLFLVHLKTIIRLQMKPLRSTTHVVSDGTHLVDGLGQVLIVRVLWRRVLKQISQEQDIARQALHWEDEEIHQLRALYIWVLARLLQRLASVIR